MRTLFYSIGQGIRNLLRNKGYAAASVATMTACLFLFGLFYSVITNIQAMVRNAEEGVSVTVFFQPGVTEDQIRQIEVAVGERPEVSDVVYVSADEAWASFSKEYLGEYADGFEDNPLADSANLEIYLKDVSRQEDLVNYLQGLDIVREVNRSELTATTLTGINSLMWYASAAMIVILFIVSLFLISNTVATGISSHRDEIAIMKYIGATDFFVRGPYVFEGVIIGVLGSLLPLGLNYFIYNRVIEIISGKFSMLARLLTFLPVQTVFRTLIPVSLILGVGIGFFGSVFTVRKHLHV